jgi:hypothetical protein
VKDKKRIKARPNSGSILELKECFLQSKRQLNCL